MGALCSRDSPHDKFDAGHEDPCGGGLNELLEILGQPPISVEPGESSLDNPAPWQEDEAFCSIGAFDNFQGPLAKRRERVRELLAGVATIVLTSQFRLILGGLAYDASRFWGNLGSGSGVWWGGGRPDLGDRNLLQFWELKPEGGDPTPQITRYGLFNVYTPGVEAPAFFVGNFWDTPGTYGQIFYQFDKQGEIYYNYVLRQPYQVSTPFALPKWITPVAPAIQGAGEALVGVLEAL